MKKSFENFWKNIWKFAEKNILKIFEKYLENFWKFWKYILNFLKKYFEIFLKYLEHFWINILEIFVKIFWILLKKYFGSFWKIFETFFKNILKTLIKIFRQFWKAEREGKPTFYQLYKVMGGWWCTEILASALLLFLFQNWNL